MKSLILLVFIGHFFSCQSESEKSDIVVIEKEKKFEYESSLEAINGNTNSFIDSIKIVDLEEFQIVFYQFNKEFNLWYSPKLIVDGDTILITGLDNENGSELSIRKSLNGRFFIMDNIIKGYVEDGNGEKILHENFMCVIVNVKEAKVEQSLQSECDGVWNEQDEWVSSGNVVFAP